MKPVAVPTAFPVPGVFDVTQRITLSCATPSAQIYYTLNGSPPSPASLRFDPYKLPVLEALSQGEQGLRSVYTLRAVAAAAGMQTSAEASFTYTLERRDQYAYISSELFPGIRRIRDYDNDNMYLVVGQQRALLIDAGMGRGDLRRYVEAYTGGLPLQVFITHAHPDHIACLGQFQQDCPVSMHLADLPLLKRFIERMHYDIDPERLQDARAGFVFDLGGCMLTVYELPGHSAGSLVLLDEERGVLFCGDALGSNRASIPDSLWMQMSSVMIDEYLSTLLDFRSKVGGKIRVLLNGHNDDPLYGQTYLNNLQQAAQNLVDRGMEALTPSLRPTEVWQVVVGDRLADPDWAAINVNRDHCLSAPPDKIATLSRLELSHGRLKETFRPGLFKYSALVDPQAVSVRVTPTPTSTRVRRLSINGEEVKPGSPHLVRLASGVTRLEIAVTAPDGVTSQVYELVIHKPVQLNLYKPGFYSAGAEAPSQSMKALRAGFFSPGRGFQELSRGIYPRRCLEGEFIMTNEKESYSQLEANIYRRLQAGNIASKAFELILNAFEDALEAEKVEISEVQEERWFESVINTIVKDLYKKID